MDPIYVTGHRNPDTDSIVAAMAYASLRNALGDREYEAACLGPVSDETQLVLDYFGFLPRWLTKLSPFHGSVYITSMASLGIPPIFHHLYDFGNVFTAELVRLRRSGTGNAPAASYRWKSGSRIC